jgi:hypothetical protein
MCAMLCARGHRPSEETPAQTSQPNLNRERQPGNKGSGRTWQSELILAAMEVASFTVKSSPSWGRFHELFESRRLLSYQVRLFLFAVIPKTFVAGASRDDP